jgi:hypothetical protein
MPQASSSQTPVRVQSITAARLAVGLAGTAGTGSLGLLVVTLTRVTAAPEVSAGMWAALTALVITTAAVAALALVLEYRRKKLEIEAQVREKEAAAELQKIRLEKYLGMLEKAASEPGSAEAYRQLMIADALHQSVENGVRLADRTHEHLYGPSPPGTGQATVDQAVSGIE